MFMYLCSDPTSPKTPGNFNARITIGDDELLVMPSYVLDVAAKISGQRTETVIQLLSLFHAYPTHFCKNLFWTFEEFKQAQVELTDLLTGHIPQDILFPPERI